MPQRFQLQTRQTKLLEIRNIIHSMKMLALLESRKLQAKSDYLVQMEQAMIALTDDFSCSFSGQHVTTEPGKSVLIVIGSERGFCGNFNNLVREQALPKLNEYNQVYIVGTKLSQLSWPENCNCTKLAGAHVVEDVEAVAWQMLPDLLIRHKTASKDVIAHDSIQETVLTQPLYPFPIHQTTLNRTYPFEPVLNVTLTQFATELAERYLIFTLQRVMYFSLMRENERRMIHLENATDHLDDQNEQMLRRINELRQEEIIEEIEVILLRKTKTL